MSVYSDSLKSCATKNCL